jgi:Rrf2 family iron-sulfur cluster assembly transcriptional regulator
VKLTAKGRYAVMAMTDLASQGPDALVSLGDISARQKISLSFLEQLFRQIRQAGLIESQRGAQGGYRLSRRPADVTLDQIIKAVDEPIKAHGCTPDARHSCTGSSERCLTHDLWGALESHIGQFMASISLADVIAGRVSPLVMEAAE